MSIPRRLWSAWLTVDMQTPPLIEKCLATHKLDGYEYNLITLAEAKVIAQNHPYLKDCLTAKKYAKACDYIRAWLLEKHGGVWVDADYQLDKSFDDILDNQMFMGEEENGYICNAVWGSVPHHSLLQEYLGIVERNFKGDGELTFQAGVFLLTELIKGRGKRDDVTILTPDYFYPYQHQIDKMTVTANTHGIHWFAKSWTT